MTRHVGTVDARNPRARGDLRPVLNRNGKARDNILAARIARKLQRKHHGTPGAALVELSDFILAEPFGCAILADIADAEHATCLVLVHLERILPGITLLRRKLLQLPALKLEQRCDADVAVRIPAVIRPRIERVRRAAVCVRTAARITGITR